MPVKLFSAPLPKGTGGRKAAEIDGELHAALLAALTDNPTIIVDGETRPQVYGDSSRVYETEGKASSDGRRYARPIAEKIGKTVRVRVVDAPAVKIDGKESPRYGWVLYVPSETPSSNGDSASA